SSRWRPGRRTSRPMGGTPIGRTPPPAPRSPRSGARRRSWRFPTRCGGTVETDPCGSGSQPSGEPGKNLLFLATLAILTVPYATILIPLYVVLGHLGLQNSLV